MSLYETLGGRLKDNHIRLFSVQGATEGGDDVRCNLEVYHLDTAPEYYAVSYTWGQPAAYGKFRTITEKRESKIVCNGLDPIKVTENLQALLRQIPRDPSLKAKLFWADAICINQDDTEEKTAQIQLMTKIYSRFSRVLIWLGEHDEYTEQGFELIRELGSNGNLQPYRTDDIKWLSVAKIFQRRYFNRAWVVQEVILGGHDGHVEAWCGSHSIGWPEVSKASHTITKNGWREHLDDLLSKHEPADEGAHSRPFYGFPTILTAIGKDLKQGTVPWTESLLNALIRSRNLDATVPEDKVFSLLGLVHKHVRDKSLLKPIYENPRGPLGPLDAYKNLAIQILKDSQGDLLLLSCVESERFQLDQRWPSWVPDWRCKKQTGLRKTGYKRYWASNEWTQKPEFDKSLSVLELKGIRLDDVDNVGEAKHEVLGPKKKFPIWLEILKSLPDTYPGGIAGESTQSRYEAFWRTLICNTSGPEAGITPKNSVLGASFAEWMEERTKGWDEAMELMKDDWFKSAMSTETPHDDAADFQVRLRHAQHLRLFRTQNGHLGLGTECMKNGDSVWVIPGSRIPLIFRPVDKGEGGRYRLVGGAYVHGFMHGEAVSHFEGKGNEEVLASLETLVIE